MTAGHAVASPCAPRAALPRWLLPLLVLFVAKGILFAFLFAPFTGHDEVDHFFYIQRLAHGDGLGVVGEEALPPAAEPYQDYVADFPFNAEVIQPPLYHLLLTPIVWFTPGGTLAELLALRLVSVLLGAVAVVASYLVAKAVFPAEPVLHAGATVFVALQPQFAFEAAIVNHDILVILLSTLVVLHLCRAQGDGFSARREVVLVLLLAAGLWTKPSFGLLIPVVSVAIIAEGWARQAAWRSTAERGARIVLPAVLVASPWFLRSLWLYGDPTAASRLREIPEYGEQAQSFGAMVGSAVFWRGRLEDFWGNFGWRLIPFDLGTYRAIYVLWLVAIGGLVVLGVGEMRQRPGRLLGPQWRCLGIIAVWIAAMIGGVLYVGTIQFTQSRFAFPAMAGFGLLSVLGWSRVLPARVSGLLPSGIVAAMVALNLVFTVRFVAPFYYGAGGVAVLAP